MVQRSKKEREHLALQSGQVCSVTILTTFSQSNADGQRILASWQPFTSFWQRSWGWVWWKAGSQEWLCSWRCSADFWRLSCFTFVASYQLRPQICCGCRGRRRLFTKCLFLISIRALQSEYFIFSSNNKWQSYQGKFLRWMHIHASGRLDTHSSQCLHNDSWWQ